MNFKTLMFLLILMSLGTLLRNKSNGQADNGQAAYAQSEPPGFSGGTVPLMMPPEFPRQLPTRQLGDINHIESNPVTEQQLLSGYKQALKVSNKTSGVAFEKLFDLVCYYAQTNNDHTVVELSDDLALRFAKLQPNEQKHFASKLVKTAAQAARQNQPGVALALYSPVTTNLNSSWKGESEIANALSDLADCIQKKGQELEAEKILAAAIQIQPKEADARLLRKLADLRYKLKMYDKASLDYEDLVKKSPQTKSRSIEDMQRLIESGQRLGHTEKLQSIAEQTEKECKNIREWQGAIRLERAIGDLIKTNLKPELIKRLCKAYLDGCLNLKDGTESFPTQVNALRYLSNACKQAGKLELGGELYKIWTDQQKSLLGAQSEHWLEAMENRFTFGSQNHMDPEMDAAEIEIKTVQLPAKSSVLLRYLRLQVVVLQGHRFREKPDVSEWLKKVPNDLQGVECYFEAAEICNNLRQPDLVRMYESNGIRALTKILPEQDQWLAPYLMDIVEANIAKNTERPGDRLSSRFTHDLISSVKKERSGEKIDYVVMKQLAAMKLEKEELAVMAEHLKRMGIRREKQQITIENTMKAYIRMLEREQGLKYVKNATPDPKFLKTAYNAYLEGIMQTNFGAAPKDQGLTIVSFEINIGLVGNITVTKSAGQARDKIALKSVDDVKLISNSLPGTSRLQFEASFDHRTGQVKVN